MYVYLDDNSRIYAILQGNGQKKINCKLVITEALTVGQAQLEPLQIGVVM